MQPCCQLNPCELDTLLGQPVALASFVDGEGAAYREKKLGLRDKMDREKGRA